jgi:hypothetical protein
LLQLLQQHLSHLSHQQDLVDLSGQQDLVDPSGQQDLGHLSGQQDLGHLSSQWLQLVQLPLSDPQAQCFAPKLYH